MVEFKQVWNVEFVHMKTHECEDFVSMCCGAERNEYVEYFCSACNEGAGFECVECSTAEKD